MAFKDVDWAELRAKLPYEKTEEQKAKRMALFDRFDMQGNGILSLAEATKGVRDELGLDDVLVKAPVDAAYHKAKKVNSETKGKSADDFVDRREFRLFLFYLRQYFEFYVAFERLDTSDDHMIDRDEFKKALDQLELWVGKIDDPEETFNKIDKDGGGKIRFREFCDWAYDVGLDLEDDDD